MVTIKSSQEIELMRVGGRLLAATLGTVAAQVQKGVFLYELDALAHALLLKGGGEPAFVGYGKTKTQAGFPSTLCISVNDEVVHGVGNRKRILKEGDIVGLDIGVRYPRADGLYTDMATTVGVGAISPQARELVDTAQSALFDAIEHVRPGAWVSDLSKAIQQRCERKGYGAVRDLTGHGIGRAIHEDPSIFCYWKKGLPDVQLVKGMVLCIEPMITLGGWQVKVDTDGWTIRTADGSLAAHAEHTIAVTADGYEILTRVPY